LGFVSTITQRNAAEGAVLQALTAAGIHILIPLVMGLPSTSREWFPTGGFCGCKSRLGVCAADASNSTQAVQITAMASCTTAGVDDCPSFRGYLRLDATRNNQRRGVPWRSTTRSMRGFTRSVVRWLRDRFPRPHLGSMNEAVVWLARPTGG